MQCQHQYYCGACYYWRNIYDAELEHYPEQAWWGVGTEHRPFFHAHTAEEHSRRGWARAKACCGSHGMGAMPWAAHPVLEAAPGSHLMFPSISSHSFPVDIWAVCTHKTLLLMRREDFLLKLLLFCAQRVPFLFFRCSFSTAQAIPSPSLGPEVLTSVSAFSFLIFSSTPIRLQCAHSMCSQVASKAEHPIPWLTFWYFRQHPLDKLQLYFIDIYLHSPAGLPSLCGTFDPLQGMHPSGVQLSFTIRAIPSELFKDVEVTYVQKFLLSSNANMFYYMYYYLCITQKSPNSFIFSFRNKFAKFKNM